MHCHVLIFRGSSSQSNMATNRKRSNDSSKNLSAFEFSKSETMKNKTHSPEKDEGCKSVKGRGFILGRNNLKHLEQHVNNSGKKIKIILMFLS